MTDHHQGGTTPADLEPAGDTETSAAPAAHTEDADQAERLRQERDDYRDRLLRMTAEFDNYRKRVERDRAVEYARGVADVVDAVIPVLDDLDAARRHGELTGPFAAIAEKLEAVLAQRFGVARFGEPGEDFDPTVHEALLHSTSDEVEDTSVSLVLQPGYRVGERVVRAARVAVVGPE
jgi:molecular chaperone GrpE